TSARPLKGGKAFTGHTPTGEFSQLLLQGENPSVPSRQSQETIRTRTYTLPSDQLNASTLQRSNAPTVFLTEREESRAGTELGAAQKDTARELGAKLSSLKSLVWVG